MTHSKRRAGSNTACRCSGLHHNDKHDEIHTDIPIYIKHYCQLNYINRSQLFKLKRKVKKLSSVLCPSMRQLSLT